LKSTNAALGLELSREEHLVSSAVIMHHPRIKLRLQSVRIKPYTSGVS